MIWIMMAVKDVKLDVMHVPFFAKTVYEGRRLFAAACMEDNSMLKRFPEDFTLHLLGTFDDATGVVKQEEPFTLVAIATRDGVMDA